MSTHGLIRFGWVLAFLLGACVPALRVPQEPQALPSPAGDWTLKLTQSGGFAGVMLTVEVSSNGRLTATNERGGKTVTQTVPPETLAQLVDLYARTRVTASPAPRSSCADCFAYSLEYSSGGKPIRIDADDTTLQDSGAAELVRFMQHLRDEALKSLP